MEIFLLLRNYQNAARICAYLCEPLRETTPAQTLNSFTIPY